MKPQVGDHVLFGSPNGEKTLGEVVKVNRTRAKVRQLETRGTKRIRSEGVWNVPFPLIEPANRTAAEPKVKRPDAEILADLLQVECKLSPENLYCDGERSHSAAQRAGRALNRERRELVRELGREPAHQEVWGAR